MPVRREVLLEDLQGLQLPAAHRFVPGREKRLIRVGSDAPVLGPAPDAGAVHLPERPLERVLQLLRERPAKSVVVAEEAPRAVGEPSQKAKGPVPGGPAHVLSQRLDIVGDELAVVEGRPGVDPLGDSFLGRPAHGVISLLLQRHRPQELYQTVRFPIVARHHRRKGVTVLTVDDGVDHGVEGEVPCRREGTPRLRVAKHDVQELVADHGLDVLVRPAVEVEELEVHQEPRPVRASHGQSGHGRREDDIEDLQDGPDSEGILVDEFDDDVPEPLFCDGCHA